MTDEMFHGDAEPEWGPLEALLPIEQCGPFMYMGWFELDGRRLHHYKHAITRRYLLVTDELKTHRYTGELDYEPEPRKAAIRHAR